MQNDAESFRMSLKNVTDMDFKAWTAEILRTIAPIGMIGWVLATEFATGC